MIGETVSHYRVIELLGAGGMGVVYKAEDTRLRRFVALKFLPPNLIVDREAKERLIQEAQAASALDDSNICTIHEIDETPDGRLFIVMAYYEGETLRQRIARGPISVDDAIDVAAHVARGVAAAHDAAIVHRDINPANIIITRHGEVKLMDFGLAKLQDRTGLTRTGVTVGTPAYMAPEQVCGSETDARTDVWALGIVLYEMLARRRPFDGEHDVALLHAIVHDKPRPLRDNCPDVSSELEAIVNRALQRQPVARYASARELLHDLSSVQTGRAPAKSPDTVGVVLKRYLMRRSIVVTATAALVILTAAAGWSIYSGRNTRWARETTLPEIERLIGQDNYVKALALSRDAERTLGQDPALATLFHDAGLVVRSVQTNPPGASVFVRDPFLRSDWLFLGRTPLKDAKLPVSVVRWKIDLTGYEPVEFVSATGSGLLLPKTVELTPIDSVPDGMVKVPAASLNLNLTGYDYNKMVPSAEYLIDRYEITNKQFKEFVESGGYQKGQYWTHEFVKDGSVLPWEEAVAQFLDQTGRPGPSTWEVGTYTIGQDDYPVGGVSWYEAAAYAEFRGKNLPTVYHWIHAAGTWTATQITPLSNFSGHPMPVGQSEAISPFGLYDVAGNVKEWCLNEMQPGATRYILGAGWSDAEYQFVYPDARSPFDRSPVNGFRTVTYLKPESLPAASILPIEHAVRNYQQVQPVSDDVFRVIRNLYSYDPIPLAPAIDRVDDSSVAWRREVVSFAATYDAERVLAHLFLPKNAKPPFQVILFWPGSTAIRALTSEPPAQIPVIDWLIQSGRAVMYPVYYGTYERHVPRDSSYPEMTHAYRDWVMKQISDARRSIDYLESRSDISRDAIGYLGFSWGGRMAPLVLALDSRPRAAVLFSGGFAPMEAPPEVDPPNFAPRVSVPVLMLNGVQDYIYEVDTSQKPLFQFLGTPPDGKRYVVLPAGHSVIYDKRAQVIREALDWFDRYLGPVK